jgi:multidrug efflux pump subunit AcrA (membrane-fusion protein)
MTTQTQAPTVRVDELIAGVDRARAAAAKAKGEAAAKLDASRTAAEQIDAARAKAEAAAAEARSKAGAQLLDAMRRLTDEVRQARAAAAEAIRTGDAPLEAWLRYRRVRGTDRGMWQALGAQYLSVTGSPRFPPGDWGPDVVAQYNSSLPEQVPAETFADFLTAVTHRMEQQLQGEADAATRHEIERATDRRPTP